MIESFELACTGDGCRISPSGEIAQYICAIPVWFLRVSQITSKNGPKTREKTQKFFCHWQLFFQKCAITTEVTSIVILEFEEQSNFRANLDVDCLNRSTWQHWIFFTLFGLLDSLKSIMVDRYFGVRKMVEFPSKTWCRLYKLIDGLKLIEETNFCTFCRFLSTKIEFRGSAIESYSATYSSFQKLIDTLAERQKQLIWHWIPNWQNFFKLASPSGRFCIKVSQMVFYLVTSRVVWDILDVCQLVLREDVLEDIHVFYESQQCQWEILGFQGNIDLIWNFWSWWPLKGTCWGNTAFVEPLLVKVGRPVLPVDDMKRLKEKTH